MRIVGFVGVAVSLMLCAVSGLLLVPSCAPAGAMGELPRLSLGLDFQGGAVLTYELQVPEGVDGDIAGEQAAEVLMRRLDAVGSPAVVTRRGDTIRIEVAGTDAATMEATRGAIGRSSTLELRVLDDLSNVLDTVSVLPPGVSRETETITDFRDPMGGVIQTSYLTASGPTARADLERVVATLPASGSDVLLGRLERYDDPDAAIAEPAWRTYVVHREVHVDGSRVADAYVINDEMMGRPNVMIELDEAGRAAFAQMTTDAVKRRIAIIVDDEVMSAPIVQEPIPGGRAQITLGSYLSYDEMLQQANDLVLTLRAGSLPAPIQLVDESIVHATYGESLLVWIAIGALVLLLVTVGAGALRYRSATVFLATPLPVVVSGLAALALLDATLSLAGVGGIAVAGVATLIGSIVVAERVRRGEATLRRRLVAAAIVPALLVILGIAGGVLFAATSGMARGFAAGLFVTSLAGIVPALLFAGGASAALRSSGTPPPAA